MNEFSYVEAHGIIDYDIVNKCIIYYANYPEYLSTPKHTIKVVYNMVTRTEKRTILKKWNPRGNSNQYK